MQRLACGAPGGVRRGGSAGADARPLARGAGPQEVTHAPTAAPLVLIWSLLASSALATAATTTLVTLKTSGSGPANGDSSVAAVSANGRYLAFVSDASDLVADDTNGAQDVFVRDLQKGVTMLVSRNRAGTGSGNGRSDAPVMSASGRYVAFVSHANDLAEDDTNGDPPPRRADRSPA